MPSPPRPLTASPRPRVAYYFDHRQEIEAEFKNEEELAEKLRPLFPSKLQEKLRG